MNHRKTARLGKRKPGERNSEPCLCHSPFYKCPYCCGINRVNPPSAFVFQRIAQTHKRCGERNPERLQQCKSYPAHCDRKGARDLAEAGKIKRVHCSKPMIGKTKIACTKHQKIPEARSFFITYPEQRNHRQPGDEKQLAENKRQSRYYSGY